MKSDPKRLAEPWRDGRVTRLLYTIPVHGAPIELKYMGTTTDATEHGLATTEYLAVAAQGGADRDERSAIKAAILRKLGGRPSGMLLLNPPRKLNPLASPSGAFLVDLQLDKISTPAYQSDNDTAVAISEALLECVHRFVRICITTLESEDLATDHTWFGRYAGITFLGANDQILDHRPFRLIPPPSPSSLDKRTIQTRYKYASSSHLADHPIDQVIIWRIRAQRQADIERDYQSSAVALNTSMEICLWAVARALHQDLLRCGSPQNQQRATKLGNVLSGTNYADVANQIGTVLEKRMWHSGRSLPVGPPLATIPPELAAYWSDTYPLRNRVVHEGHAAVLSEIEGAFKAYYALWEYLRDLVCREALSFPGTALMLLGMQELYNRNLLTTALQQAIERADQLHPKGTWNSP